MIKLGSQRKIGKSWSFFGNLTEKKHHCDKLLLSANWLRCLMCKTNQWFPAFYYFDMLVDLFVLFSSSFTSETFSCVTWSEGCKVVMSGLSEDGLILIVCAETGELSGQTQALYNQSHVWTQIIYSLFVLVCRFCTKAFGSFFFLF